MQTLSAVSPDQLQEVFERIPLALAMQLQVTSYVNGRLVLSAPFVPNRNHAGIAFGGSIECIATLAGWGLVWLRLGETNANIVIHASKVRFMVPLTRRLTATAFAPSGENWQRFTQMLARRGRAGIDVRVTVGDETTRRGAQFRGDYAVTRDKARTNRREAAKSG